MIKFERVSWKNFLSTGNSQNEIQLDNHATTLIIGKNGEGKSTVLDALCYGLFGKPFRNVKKLQLINSINQKKTLIEVEFSIGNNKYKVVRGIKPNLFEIYQNGELLNQDAAARDYQKVLEQQILKLNYKTFTQVVILGSASFVPFMQLPPSTRREVIEDILDIKIFSTMKTLLREKIQGTKDELSKIETQVDIAKSKVESQQAIIQTLTTAKEDSVAAIQSKIDKANKEIAELQSNVKNTNDKIKELQVNIEDKSEVEQRVEETKKQHVQKSHHKDSLLKTLEFFEENNECPSCAQGIPHDHKTKMVKQLESQQNDFEKELQSLTTQKEELHSRVEEIQKIVTEISDKTLEISGYNSSISTLNKHIQELVAEKEEHHTDNEDISAEKQKLKELAKDAVEMIDKKKEIAEKRNLEEIASALLRDTGIKTSIIREYLPAMNKLINKYLTAMDFYVHFELDEAFNEIIKSRYRDEFTYASFSEGEKMRIDLAILFTWRQIAKMKNSVNTNLLILDEIFDSSLDVAGTDYFLSLMSSLGENSNVFVISHKGDQLVDKFNNVIQFEKRNDFSIIL